jgi:hypothetical protein
MVVGSSFSVLDNKTKPILRELPMPAVFSDEGKIGCALAWHGGSQAPAADNLMEIKVLPKSSWRSPLWTSIPVFTRLYRGYVGYQSRRDPIERPPRQTAAD